MMAYPLHKKSVCDFSMALLGGITRAFCGGMTVRTYVESCLDILIHKKTENLQLSCYVRIDIAHLIKMVVDGNVGMVQSCII